MHAQGQAYAMQASTTEVHVQLAPGATAEEVSTALNNAGYASLEDLPGGSEHRNIYQLSLRDMTAENRAAILATAGVTAVRPAYRLPAFDRDVVLTDQLVVRCQPGAAAAVADDFGLLIVRQLDWLGDVYVMRVADETEVDAAFVASRVFDDPRVIYSHPDLVGLYRFQQQTPVINDPFFPAQWHLSNPGGNGGVADADVDAPEAWAITQGEGILVAVLDDAVEVVHEDLADNYSGIAFDPVFGISSTPNPDLPGPLEAHGTSVTGLICASGNGIGVRGVAPKAKFMAIQLHTCGFALCATDSEIVQGFELAKESGADMVNNSWGGPITSDVLADGIRNAAITGRAGRGMLILFSSGNDGAFIKANAAQPQIPEVMAVGATQRDDTLSCYSNFGPEQSVVAPGGGAAFIADCFKADMVTTDLTAEEGFNSSGRRAFFGGFPIPVLPSDPNELANKNYTNSFNGTSASCPVATGVAALALSVNPDLSRTQLRNLIEHTADKPDAFRADFDPVTGHNIRFGHGRVNAFNAVKAAQAGKLWPTPINTIDSFVANDVVDLTWQNPSDDLQVSVLVVRSGTPITWAPDDLTTYKVGDEVFPGIVVVQDAPFNTLSETGVPLNGFVEYAFFVRNSQGRYSWGRRKSVSVTQPPDQGTGLRVTAQASLTVGEAPLTVQFAGGTQADVVPTRFQWAMDDARQLENGALRPETELFGRSVRHTFVDSGVFNVELNVTDREGRQGTATIVITVTPPNQSPVASIQATPTSGFAPLTVSFAAGGNDEDGNVVRFVWDFGDSGTGAGPFVDHTYEIAGTYTVTLTILDDDGGSSEATVDILVSGTGFGSSGQSVSAAVETAEGGAPRVLPSFCGAFGVETLAMALCGFAVIAFVNRRRT